VVLVYVHQLLARDPLGLGAQLLVLAQDLLEHSGMFEGIELSQRRARSRTHTATRADRTVVSA
jgi:hypothetical protein